MSEALVIGADISGLVAALYLARAGVRVTVLEAESVVGGSCANRVPVGDFFVPSGPHLFSALDPIVIKDLKLAKQGLTFSERDLPLISLRTEGPSVVLPRDVQQARRRLTLLSPRDGERYVEIMRKAFAFARSMRAVWWDEGKLSGEDERATLRRLALTPAATWLDAAFESEALRAAFAFDVLDAGMSPSEAGSALLLVWRAAQEMCGLQGAVALPLGGPAMLVDFLVQAAQAAGVEIRTQARVARISLEGDAVRGAQLASGELVHTGMILSSLSRKKTLLDFLPPGVAGFAAAQLLKQSAPVGEAKLVLALNTLPPVFEVPGRYVIVERLESMVLAHAEARAGKLPSDLALEIMALPTGGTPPMLLSVIARPVPLEGWKSLATQLVQTILKTLEQYAPHVVGSVGGLALVPPKPRDRLHIAEMIGPWHGRITTPVRGLYLCGEAAEPVPSVSGRAARIAAEIAVRALKGATL